MPKIMRDVLIEELHHRMREDDKIFFVTADFGSPKLDALIDEFPDRFINVGIAEQNLINVATGLALEGQTVYAYAIAPFITMRCYEQVRVNLALLSQVRELNVNLIGVGAGYSYDVSGPTHQSLEDLCIMRTLPNIEVLSPADCVCVHKILDYTIGQVSPKYLRLDGKPAKSLYESTTDLSAATGYYELIKGGKALVVSTGFMTQKAHEIVTGVFADEGTVGLLDMFNLSRFDSGGLAEILQRYESVITIEEGFINKGGLDSLVLHFLNHEGLRMNFRNLGLKDSYSFYIGDREASHRECGVGRERIIETIRGCL